MEEMRQEVAQIPTMILAGLGVTRDTGEGTITSTVIRAVLSTMSARLPADEIHRLTNATKQKKGYHAETGANLYISLDVDKHKIG